MKNYYSILRCGVYLVILMFLSSCFNSRAEKPEVRAVDRWNAILESDWTKAYSYETPDYRKIYSLKQYINTYGGAITWKSIQFKSAEPVSDDVVQVKLELVSSYDVYEFGDLITERWLLKEGQWWHIKK